MNSSLETYTMQDAVTLRPVVIEDAPFILSLRQNPQLSKHLNSPPQLLADQVRWLDAYMVRRSFGSEYYFVIMLATKSVGVVRIYNVAPPVFTWGSWIIGENVPSNVAAKSVVELYNFAFFDLNLERANFEVCEENWNVKRFHELYGATKLGKDSQFSFYEFTREQYISSTRILQRFSQC